MTASPDAVEVLKKAYRQAIRGCQAHGYYCSVCHEETPFGSKRKALHHAPDCWVGQAERLLKGEGNETTKSR